MLKLAFVKFLSSLYEKGSFNCDCYCKDNYVATLEEKVQHNQSRLLYIK